MTWAAATFTSLHPSLSYSIRGWSGRAEEGALLLSYYGSKWWVAKDRHV